MCDVIDVEPCTIKRLPPELQMEAALAAIEENPDNAVDPAHLASAQMMTALVMAPDAIEAAPLEPAHLALLVSRRRAATGVNLTVGFLEQPTVALLKRILGAANRWGEFANVRFNYVASAARADIRITFLQSGYWSYLGTDSKLVAAGQATMCYQAFSDRTTDAEITRVVTHEFGHALGFVHEHVTKEIRERIDPEAAIAEFMQSQGWSRADVIAQVLEGPPESDLLRSPSDPQSIMCYALPARIMKDHVAVPGGVDFSPTDRVKAAEWYPLPVTPPPPPPPPPPTGTWAFTVEGAGDKPRVTWK